MLKWSFFQTSFPRRTGRWLWACERPDSGIVKTSKRTFQNYAACLQDALDHGYSGPTTEPAAQRASLPL